MKIETILKLIPKTKYMSCRFNSTFRTLYFHHLQINFGYKSHLFMSVCVQTPETKDSYLKFLGTSTCSL